MIHREARACYEMVSDRRNHLNGTAGSDRPLVRALQEKAGIKARNYLPAARLAYPQKDIYSAYTALKGSIPDRRSRPEFLDNVLHSNLKSIILLLGRVLPDAPAIAQ